MGASDGGPTNGWRTLHARSARQSGRLRRDRAALPGHRFSDCIRDHRLSGRCRGCRAGGFREGISLTGDVPHWSGAAALAAEDRRRMLDHVNALPDDDRLVIANRYFLELSGEETAAALGIPEGTVKSRLSRALARLRQRMEEGAGA